MAELPTLEVRDIVNLDDSLINQQVKMFFNEMLRNVLSGRGGIGRHARFRFWCRKV